MPTQIINNNFSTAIIDSYITIKDIIFGYGLLAIFITLLITLTWIIATLLENMVKKVIDSIKLDNALQAVGLRDILNKANIGLNTGLFFGGIIKWSIIAGMFISILNMIGFGEVSEVLSAMLIIYLPRIIMAILILLFSFIIGDVLKKIVKAFAVNAHITSAKGLGNITKITVIVFGVLSALIELGIATTIINTLFMGVIAGSSLAFGLAFGLGGRGLAEKILIKAEKEFLHDTTLDK